MTYLCRETNKVQNSPSAYGFLAGAILLILGLLVNASCIHASKLETLNVGANYDAAVEIEAMCIEPDGKMSGWHGTGVIVSPTRILTAGHVAETEPGEICSFTAEDADGKLFLIFPKVILSSKVTDLASMEMISFTEKFKSVGMRFGKVPKLGEIVCTATAHPRREDRCGPVMKSKEPPGDIRINMVVEPGNSGSALYNMRGELVGIVVHTYPNRNNGQYVSGGASSLEGHVKELLP